MKGTNLCEKNHLSKQLLITFLISVLVIGLFFYIKDLSIENLWKKMTESKALSMLLFLFLFGIKLILWIIPLKVLYFAAGYLLPFWLAIGVIYSGRIVHFTVSYYFGKMRGLQVVMKQLDKRKSTHWLLDNIKNNANFSCFIIRTIPGPPVEVTNMLFRTLKVPFVNYLRLSLAGVSFVTPPLIILGLSTNDASSVDFQAPLLLAVGVPLVSIAVYWISVKNQKDHSKY